MNVIPVTLALLRANIKGGWNLGLIEKFDKLKDRDTHLSPLHSDTFKTTIEAVPIFDLFIWEEQQRERSFPLHHSLEAFSSRGSAAHPSPAADEGWRRSACQFCQTCVGLSNHWPPCSFLLEKTDRIRDCRWWKPSVGNPLCHLLLPCSSFSSSRCGSMFCLCFSLSLWIPVSLLTFPTTEVLINAGCTLELLKFIALFPHCRSINTYVLFLVLCLTSQESAAFLLGYHPVFKFVLLQHISLDFVSLVQPGAVYCVVVFLSSPADCNLTQVEEAGTRLKHFELQPNCPCSGSNKN